MLDRPITRPLDLRRLGNLERGRFIVTPFVDLALLLLFFGLLGWPLLSSPGIEISLPATSPRMAEPAQPAAAVLALDRHGTFYLQGQRFGPEALATRLREVAQAHGPRPVLLVKADRRTPLQRLSELFTTAREAGFTSVQIAAEPSPEENSAIQHVR